MAAINGAIVQVAETLVFDHATEQPVTGNARGSLKLPPPFHSPSHRHLIGILNIAPRRNSRSNPRHLQLTLRLPQLTAQDTPP